MNKDFNSFKKWIKWCKECNIDDVFPAKDFDIALYLTSLIQSQTSVSVTEGVYYSLKLAHDLALFDNNPCDSKLVKFVLDSCKRECGKPVVKKKPFTVVMIKDLFENFHLIILLYTI